MEHRRVGTSDAARFLSDETGVRHTTRTLEHWRHRDVGPAYIKIAGRVVYDVQDLKDFAASCRHVPDPDRSAA